MRRNAGPAWTGIAARHGPEYANHLVFELKKSTNREPDDRDLAKLRAYGRHLGYDHGVFIRFVVEQDVPDVSRAEFVYPD
jgi:hypothetical protein